MSENRELMRKYSDIVVEAEVISEGPYDSKVAVSATDPKRVQVAPNVQNKVVQYDRQQQAVDAANSEIRRRENPNASKIGDTIGGTLGDVVAGTRAAWDSGVNAFKGKTAPIADPAKPIDVIPDPRRGTSTPRLPQAGGAPGQRVPQAPQATRPVAPDPTQANRSEPNTQPTSRPAVDLGLTDADRARPWPRNPDGSINLDARESAGEAMRKLADIVSEAKDPENVKKSANDLMKPYK